MGTVRLYMPPQQPDVPFYEGFLCGYKQIICGPHYAQFSHAQESYRTGFGQGVADRMLDVERRNKRAAGILVQSLVRDGVDTHG